MRNKIILLLIISTIFAGCNTGSSERRAKKRMDNNPSGSDMKYKGQVEGCVKHYNDFFCPKEYKDGTLASGETIYFKDENGSFAVLNKKLDDNSTKYIKMDKDK